MDTRALTTVPQPRHREDGRNGLTGLIDHWRNHVREVNLIAVLRAPMEGPAMADERDPLLTGAAFDLAAAGYKPMPDREQKVEEEIGSDVGSLREAADKISTPRDEVVVREYRDQNGKPAAATEAVTLERASRDYASAVAAEKLIVES